MNVENILAYLSKLGQRLSALQGFENILAYLPKLGQRLSAFQGFKNKLVHLWGFLGYELRKILIEFPLYIHS